MSETVRIDPVQGVEQGSSNEGPSGKVFFSVHNTRPLLQVDLSDILTDWPHDLTKDPELGYNKKEGKREQDSKPPLKETVSHEQKLRELFDRLRDNPEEIDSHIEHAKSRGATFSFSQAAADGSEVASPLAKQVPPPAARPADAPPLWAERTTGREVSPGDWIKMYYGNKNVDDWHPLALTRDLLVDADKPLSRAYASMISRDKDSALPGLPPMDVTHIDDPIVALARKREQVKDASKRYRSKLRNAI